MNPRRLLCLAAASAVSTFAAEPAWVVDGKSVVVGNVRVQPLSPTLVRIEEKGPLGFEDRETFLVVERDWPGLPFAVDEDGDTVTVTPNPRHYQVRIPREGATIDGVVVQGFGHRFAIDRSNLPRRPRPPEPRAFGFFAVADSPRIVSPAWGATPAPEGALPSGHPLAATSGWDLRNDAPDVYVFAPPALIQTAATHGGPYAWLFRERIPLGSGEPSESSPLDAWFRAEYLRLTGPIPMPPLFALGFWDSRYHPYTEEEALGVIDRYRAEGIPLDVFVVDTDWRVGGSRGYEISAEHFPDMPRFIREAHARNVRLMFNDHPERHGTTGLDPAEFQYRWNGLTKLLGMGMDFWWYDKNWPDIMPGPVDGIDREVWGQRVYTDTHARFRPGERPIVMSMRSDHPASHRYPIWWTGDIHSTFRDLRQGVVDSVSDGTRLLPWVNQDLGGHTGDPSTELYVRYVQWGCLSPITRVHCTRGKIRYPWAFGEEAQRIVTDYAELRYRLLPYLYAAARRAYDDGTPLLRRCDFEWPDHEEARSNLQYLLGNEILVAPVTEGRVAGVPVPDELLRTPDGRPGLRGAYFGNRHLEGPPAFVRNDPNARFDWGFDPPREGWLIDEFSVRWTGRLGPMPETGTYDISMRSDDGVRLWIDDRPVIDNWTDHPSKIDQAPIRLEKGRVYPLKIEFYDGRNDAICELGWATPGKDEGAQRAVWIPPGTWEDAWTGTVVEGPETIDVASPLWHTPIWIRRGSIVPSVPEMTYTGEKPWDRVAVDVYPFAMGECRPAVLYEDDGRSTGYRQGECARTEMNAGPPVRDGRLDPGELHFRIAPAVGAYPGQVRDRAWVVRLHLRKGQAPRDVLLATGEADPAPHGAWRRLEPADLPADGEPLPMPLLGAGSPPPFDAGPVIEVDLPREPTSVARRIVFRLK